MFAVRKLVCLATLFIGASALVMDPLHHVERNLGTAAHRRHAANILGRSSAPRRSIAERRALRQKRCVDRQHSTLSSSVEPTSSADTVPQNVAPEPSPQPTSTSVEQQPSPSQESDTSSGNDGNVDSGSDTYSGDLTFYDVGLGACGMYNSNSDMIAAIGWQFFDSFGGFSAGQNPNNAPICNKRAAINYQGKSITVTIVDRCGGCEPQDLDLSPTAFSMLADQSLGRLHGATWHFV